MYFIWKFVKLEGIDGKVYIRGGLCFLIVFVRVDGNWNVDYYDVIREKLFFKKGGYGVV